MTPKINGQYRGHFVMHVTSYRVTRWKPFYHDVRATENRHLGVEMEQSFESSHFEVRVSTSPMLRVQEKEEFQKLNDRLAAYIERIKGLKGTNLSLEAEITVLKTDITAAAQKVKDSYDARLAHKRAMIDKTAKEKARQQLLAQNFSTDNSRLRRE